MKAVERTKLAEWHHDTEGPADEVVAWANELPPASRLRLVVALEKGASYDILLRAETVAGGPKSGLALRLDYNGSGSASLHLIVEGREVPVVLTTTALPVGVVWGKGKRDLDIDLGPNSLALAVDGFPVLAVEELGLACIRAALASALPPSTAPLPAHGRYGIRVPAGTSIKVDAVVEGAR